MLKLGLALWSLSITLGPRPSAQRCPEVERKGSNPVVEGKFKCKNISTPWKVEIQPTMNSWTWPNKQGQFQTFRRPTHNSSPLNYKHESKPKNQRGYKITRKFNIKALVSTLRLGARKTIVYGGNITGNTPPPPTPRLWCMDGNFPISNGYPPRPARMEAGLSKNFPNYYSAGMIL